MEKMLSEYKTSELKLAAVILAEIIEAVFTVLPNPDGLKKIIQINFPKAEKKRLDALVRAFIERRARVEVYRYNRALNLLRDKINGK